MDTLPDEMIRKIMSFLPLEDRRRTRLVCNRWNRISYDRHLIKNDTLFIGKWKDLNNFSSITRHVRVEMGRDLGPYIESSFWTTHGEHIEQLILPRFALNLLAMHKILRSCPNLKILNLDVSDYRYCRDRNSGSRQSFEDISPIGLSKLEEVTLDYFGPVNNNCALVLDAVLSNSPRLKSIRACGRYEGVMDAKFLLPILRRCAGVLEVLWFLEVRLEADMFAEITDIVQSQLQQLYLELVDPPPNSLLIAFSQKFVNLKLLQLNCAHVVISSTVIENIATLFKKLTHLCLCFVDYSNVSRPAFISLGRMEQLTALSLEWAVITKENLIAIFSVQNLKLKKLRLNVDQPIDREILFRLCPNLPNLLWLSLDDCRIEEDAFEVIFMHNKMLKYLSAYRSISSPISDSINELKDLNELSLRGCRNISGSLSSFRLPNLERIHIEFVEVTEADVGSMIEGCSSLYAIYTDDMAIYERFKNILEGRRRMSQSCRSGHFFPDIDY